MMPRQISTIGVSWNASLPRTLVPTCPVMKIAGMESILASAMQVTKLVAPGPEVETHTLALPVVRL